MRLSDILDPRLSAAERYGVPEGDGGGDPWAAEDAAALASQLADLAELRALAMGMARRVAARAGVGTGDTGAVDGDDGAAALGDADAALNRLARTVRLTAMLEKRLRDERARGAASGGAKAGPAEPVTIEHSLLTPEQRARQNEQLVEMVQRQRTIVGVVQEVLEADGCDRETLDDVGEALRRRLLDGEASDVFNLPIGRMVARICRQMRRSPDWSRFADRDWAVEEAETRAPGSPFGDPDIPVTSFRGGVPIPHPDSGTLEVLARGFAAEAGLVGDRVRDRDGDGDEDEDDDGGGGDPRGSSP